jgi:glyoxylase-like metal-dependent hydrolase (beta-lactamase superfamily II)
MNELFVLDILPDWGDESSVIHPVVLRDDAHLVLVDCGYLDSLPKLEEAFSARNLPLSGLTHVLITHHDHDHVGTLAQLKRQYPQIEIIASRAEAPYLSASLPALRLTQARAIQPALTGDAAAAGLAFLALLAQVEPALPDSLVEEGDVLPFCGGCHVIATPGHTAGHVSFFLPAMGALIAGDAAVLQNGELALANPDYAEDLALAEQSLAHLLSMGAKRIVCYHGGEKLF